jgi:hypothetical protein
MRARLSLYMLCVWAAIAGVACSTTPARAPFDAAAAADAGVVCTYETPLGSHILQRVCLTKAQREQRDENAQALKDSMNRPRIPVCTRTSC